MTSSETQCLMFIHTLPPLQGHACAGRVFGFTSSFSSLCEGGEAVGVSAAFRSSSRFDKWQRFIIRFEQTERVGGGSYVPVIRSLVFELNVMCWV